MICKIWGSHNNVIGDPFLWDVTLHPLVTGDLPTDEVEHPRMLQSYTTFVTVIPKYLKSHIFLRSFIGFLCIMILWQDKTVLQKHQLGKKNLLCCIIWYIVNSKHMATTHFRNITSAIFTGHTVLECCISQASCLLLVMCYSFQVKVISKRLQGHFWSHLLNI